MKRVLEFIDTDNNSIVKEVLNLAIEIFRPIKDDSEFCLIAFRIEDVGTSIRFCRLSINNPYRFPEAGPDITGWLGYVKDFNANLNDILVEMKSKLNSYLEERNNH